MEFRFLVPVLVLALPLGAWLLAGAHRGVRITLVLLFAYGSLHHATTFVYDSSLEVEPKAMLEAHLFGPKEKWVKIGEALGEAFEHDPGVSIAVTAAGSISYYSQLTTIDMLGLSDRTVATEGLILGTRPGHERIAPLSYLRERRVNIAISHPTLVPLASPTFVAPFLPRPEGEPLPDAPLIEIPIDAESKLIVWYLTPSAKVDAVIARRHWKVSRVEADEPSPSKR